MKKAIVTGITGQDGAYLAEFLLSKQYQVYATYRRTSSMNFWRIRELGIEGHKNLHLVEHDLTDPFSAIHLVRNIQPDEIYNVAAQSYVGVSFSQPTTVMQANGFGAVHLLEAIRLAKPDSRYYQAGTSEMFGPAENLCDLQHEATQFCPKSPYGVSKLYAHWMTSNYRESYGLYAVNGILFNHESPLRGIEFVTRKITDGVAKIQLGIADVIELGNLNAVRDWGHAKEYVQGMWLMLQADKPDDYVLATGRTATVMDFASLAFQHADIDLCFEYDGLYMVGVDKANGRVHIRVNPKFYRPNDVNILAGNAMKAKRELGWKAQIKWEDLCAGMYEADLYRNKNNLSF